MKTVLIIICIILFAYWIDSAPSKVELKKLHFAKSIHPHTYYYIVFKDTLSLPTIQKLAGEAIQAHPQYDSVIINRILPVPNTEQTYTVVNDSGIVIFIFHFFARHGSIKPRNITCIYDSSAQNISHLGEWVH